MTFADKAGSVSDHQGLADRQTRRTHPLGTPGFNGLIRPHRRVLAGADSELGDVNDSEHVP